ncbi:MAG: hypothetical protein L3K09_05760 [Thermoplasmata archaeon]|nr:hypothetical protein [Thermoplasmata archaeon]
MLQKHRGREPTARRDLGGRATSVLATMAPAVLVVCLLFVPSAAGAKAGVITKTAPFPGTHTNVDDQREYAGCGIAHNWVKSAFHWKTGMGVFSEQASTKSCNTTAFGYNDGSAYGEMFSRIPVPVATSGTYTVTANLSFRVNMSASMVLGHCQRSARSGTSSCVELAQAYVFANAWFEDVSTGNLTSAPSSFGINLTYEVYTDCSSTCSYTTYGANGTSTGTTQVSFGFGGNALVSTDTYAVVLMVWGDAWAGRVAFSGGISGGSEQAFVNMGSAGNAFDVKSISLT